MPILKHRKSHALIKDAIVLDMSDLDRQARHIIDGALEQAATTLDEARREAATLTEKASDVGRAEGFQQGLAEGRSEGRVLGRQEAIADVKPRLEALIESWSAALSQWETDRAEMLAAGRTDVLAFAVEMGKKIVLRTIEHDPSIVEAQLTEALFLVGQRTAVAIEVNPEDRSIIEEVLPGILEKCGQCEHVAVRDEPNISRGGCVVRTANGEVDASIETQIEGIVNTLLPNRAREGASDR